MRISMTKDKELQGRNFKIFRKFFVEKENFKELSEEFELSERQLYRILDCVSKNFGIVAEKTKLAGGLLEVRERSKDLTVLRKKELQEKSPSVRSVVELETALRGNTELELRLQGLLQEVLKLEFRPEGSIVAILKEIAKDKKD